MYIYRSTIATLTMIMLPVLGGMWTLQAGILNISQEGAMLMAAFFAVLGSYMFSSFWMGLLFAVLASLMINIIYAFFCINLRANIWVIGMALNILASSLTILLLKSIFGVKGSFTSSKIQQIPSLHLGNLGPLNAFLNDFSLVVWITLGIVLFFKYVDTHTTFGLHLKAAGKNWQALDTAGISSTLIRYESILINAILVGMAGAYLSIGYLKLFNKDMSAGRGWIAVAAVIFGDGNFTWTLIATIAFGFMDALGISLQSYGLNSNLTLMFPYLAITAALIYQGVRSHRLKEKG
ncbi:ABC transporter permease [Mesoaciditoga sp.]